MVLAKLAGQVASGSTERQDRASRIEVVEGLLLDWIDTKSGRAPVTDKLDLVVQPLADIAEPALALPQPAVARAEVALNPAIIQSVPSGK